LSRALPILASLILITGAATGAYLAWDWWQKNKDSDNDGISDHLEMSKYHTDPSKVDTDDDTLNDKFEIDNNLNPLIPNPVYVYLKGKNLLGHYELFRDLDTGNLTENKKSVIDYFLSLTEELKGKMANVIKEVASDSSITNEEVVRVKDPDVDELETPIELDIGTDPFYPDHLVFHAYKNLGKDFAVKFKDVEYNGSSIGLVNLLASLTPEKRNSTEVNSLLNSIILDKAVSEQERILFDDSFVSVTFPKIKNLAWTPARVVWDEIYDINATFEAEDDKTPIAYAELRLVPKQYYWMIEKYGMNRDNYTLVFPNESERVFVLKPKDGAFDELKEEFEVPIENMTGGREYDIVALSKDQAGNIVTKNLTIPYIRQFENLGKQLYEKGIKVGVEYAPITKQHEWNGYIELGGPYKPLLGYSIVNSKEDFIVLEKEFDWMSKSGINFILYVWPGKESEGEIRDGILKEALSTLEIFKTGGTKFGILYESHWRFEDMIRYNQEGFNMSNPQNVRILKEDLSYLTEDYFNHRAYLKIDGKPFFYIYMNKGMYGDVVGSLEEVYEFMKENYGIQLYMVSDHALPEVDENWYYRDPPSVKDLVRLFDAMVTGMHHSPDYQQWGLFEDYLEMGFKYWHDFSLRNKLDYIPFVNPGASVKYCPWQPPEAREFDPGAYPRSLELWKKRIEMGIPYSNTFGIIVSWNNFWENSHLEPTVQEGFNYLKAMKEVLTKYYLK